MCHDRIPFTAAKEHWFGASNPTKQFPPKGLRFELAMYEEKFTERTYGDMERMNLDIQFLAFFRHGKKRRLRMR